MLNVILALLTPPSYVELKDVGVFWAKPNSNNGWGGADYSDELFITRLQLKYDREYFPQDLLFLCYHFQLIRWKDLYC
ncbi:MAG: hypothetical protein ACI89M_001675 [Chitinophagales bacterium]|jgi:hypothetical protein